MFCKSNFNLPNEQVREPEELQADNAVFPAGALQAESSDVD